MKRFIVGLHLDRGLYSFVSENSNLTHFATILSLMPRRQDIARDLLSALRDPNSMAWRGFQAAAEEGSLSTEQLQLYDAVAALHRFKEEGLSQNDGLPVTDDHLRQMKASILAHRIGGHTDLPDGDPYSPNSFPSADHALAFLSHLLYKQPDRALDVVRSPRTLVPASQPSTLFEGQARVDLHGLKAGFRMRTTDQGAPERLLPKDVAAQLQLETGVRAVTDLLVAQELNIPEAVVAVQRDQEAKVARAEGILAQIRAEIPSLVEQFKTALGTRHQRIEAVTDDRRTEETVRNLRDGKFSNTRTVTTRTTDESDINAPAKPGELRLPSASITIDPSRVSRFATAGFAMQDGEPALVSPRVGPDFAEVTAEGHVAIAAASVTVIESGGMTIHFDGGSMKIGG